MQAKKCDNWSLELETPEHTEKFGKLLAGSIDSPGVIAFFGDLGSGKTTLIRALGSALGVESRIVSPTFTIINRYRGGRLSLTHVDCYRIDDPDELVAIGLEEMLNEPEGLICIEWSEKTGNLLPDTRLELSLSYAGPESRTAEVRLACGLWNNLKDNLDRNFRAAEK